MNTRSPSPCRIVRAVALLILLVGTVVPLPAQEMWQGGVARVKITPEQPMWMAGYASRTRAATGTLCDLWARTLVIQDPHGERAVLVSLDLVGIDRELAASITDQLNHQFGLDRHRVALCFSHTHTGPVVGRNLEPLHYRQVDAAQQALIDQYARNLETRVVASVGEALEQLAPGHFEWGSGTAGFAVNRRNNPEAQVEALRASSELKGPVDHDVPVLAWRDTAGQLKAIVFGYACHATVLDSYEWSGDYPGFAALKLESRHPDCVALFWAGCGADQNPLPRRRVELARRYGTELADAVGRVLAGPMERLSGSLRTAWRETPLPLDRLPSLEELRQAAQSEDRYVRARANMHLEHLDAGRTLATAYPYPIGVWRLGEQVEWVFLGGEVVVDYAIRLKSELAGSATWVAGFSHDVMAYIPSARVLHEGGYEGGGAMVYYGLPTVWAPEVEQVVIGSVHQLVEQLRAAPGPIPATPTGD
jgi:neutral ceramidase